MHAGHLSEEGKSQAKSTPTARGRHGNKPCAKVREPRVSHGLEAREPPPLWSRDPQDSPTARNSEQSPLGTVGHGTTVGPRGDTPQTAGEGRRGTRRASGRWEESRSTSGELTGARSLCKWNK